MFKKIIKIWHIVLIFLIGVVFSSLLFYLGANPLDVYKFIGAKIGSAVGLSVSVPENPFNELAFSLKQKEGRLAEREKALDLKEAEIQKKSGLGENKFTLAIVLGIVILFILVTLNYYLDYRRRRAALKREGKDEIN